MKQLKVTFINAFSGQGLRIFYLVQMLNRAVARSKNPGGHIVLGGDNVPPLVRFKLIMD